MTYPFSIKLAYDFNKTIHEFGRNNYTKKLLITDYSNEHENYIIDNQYKYIKNFYINEQLQSHVLFTK